MRFLTDDMKISSIGIRNGDNFLVIDQSDKDEGYAFTVMNTILNAQKDIK